MKGITKASRINNAIQVIEKMNTGLTVVEACREVGIPRSTFYYTIDKNPQEVAEIQEIIDNNSRTQLEILLLAKNKILGKVIEDGLSAETKPKDRLAIYSKLNDLANSMTNALEGDHQIEKEAQEFLKKGPVLKIQASRFSASMVLGESDI